MPLPELRDRHEGREGRRVPAGAQPVGDALRHGTGEEVEGFGEGRARGAQDDAGGQVAGGLWHRGCVQARAQAAEAVRPQALQAEEDEGARGAGGGNLPPADAHEGMEEGGRGAPGAAPEERQARIRRAHPLQGQRRQAQEQGWEQLVRIRRAGCGRRWWRREDRQGPREGGRRGSPRGDGVHSQRVGGPGCVAARG